MIRQAQGLSERRTCRLVEMARTSYRYEPQGLEQEENLKALLRALAGERPRFGYRRLTVLLRREGWTVNHKRVYRLYGREGLQVRRRKRKRIGAVERQPLAIPTRQNERWSMDFVADALTDGRRFRSLNIVDDFNRECLVSQVDTSLLGAREVRVPEQLGERRGLPQVLVGTRHIDAVLLPEGSLPFPTQGFHRRGYLADDPQHGRIGNLKPAPGAAVDLVKALKTLIDGSHGCLSAGDALGQEAFPDLRPGRASPAGIESLNQQPQALINSDAPIGGRKQHRSPLAVKEGCKAEIHSQQRITPSGPACPNEPAAPAVESPDAHPSLLGESTDTL